MSEMAARLESILSASTVALIGASERVHYQRALLGNLERVGMARDRIYFVNPNRATVFGQPCFPTLAGLPDAPEVAVVATPAQSIPAITKECAQAGVAGLIVLSNGFGEAGREGRDRQKEIVRIAEEAGMTVMGPSSLGVLSLPRRVGFFATPVPSTLRPGVVSAIFQSGGILNLFLMQLAARGVGLSSAVVTGNEAMLDLVDYVEHALDDPASRVIVVYAESIPRGKAFGAALARAERAGKPVVVLRTGSSERGRRNVLSHSGNLASSGAAWSAFLRQRNAIEVGNFDELTDAVVLATADQVGSVHPTDRSTVLMSVSGGDCTFLADLAERTRWTLPDLTPAGHEEMVALVGKAALTDNPLDVGGLWRKGLIPGVASIVAKHSPASVVAFRLNLPDRPDDQLLDAYRSLARCAKDAGKFPVALTRASERIDDSWYSFFGGLGVPLLHEYERALRSLAAITEYHKRRADRLTRCATAVAELAETRAAIDTFEHLRPGPASFADARALLTAYGVRLAPSHIVCSREEAEAAADTLGYPVVLKTDSQSVVHRSEIGAVKVGLASAQDVGAAYDEIANRVAKLADADNAERMLVQPQLPEGVEVLVGVSRDPDLGAVVSMGLGGVLVEVYGDVTRRVAPVSERDFQEMLSELRGRPLLEGARGRPLADVGALSRVVAAVSQLAEDLGEQLAELDLNPVVVLPEGKGAWAVDALVVRSDAGTNNARTGEMKDGDDQ